MSERDTIMKRVTVCEISGLQMYSAVSVMRMSAGKSEHVLAQSNVWEMKSEKQMAALRMERGREGGGKSDESKYNMDDLCCQYARPLYFTISSAQPEREKNGGMGIWDA